MFTTTYLLLIPTYTKTKFIKYKDRVIDYKKCAVYSSLNQYRWWGKYLIQNDSTVKVEHYFEFRLFFNKPNSSSNGQNFDSVDSVDQIHRNSCWLSQLHSNLITVLQ